MCTNGVNSKQLKASIEQTNEAVALTRRWVHKAYHSCDDAGLAATAAKLKEAQSLLDDARSLLDEAADSAEREDRASGVSVELV